MKQNTDHAIFRTGEARKVFKAAGAITISPATLLKEVKQLQRTRPSRKLYEKRNLNVRTIREAVLTDQAYRGRLVSIKLDCSSIINMLQPLRDALVFKLSMNDLELPVKTKTERKDFIEFGVDSKLQILYDLYSVVEAVDLVIEDIDKSSWSLKSTLQAFELATRPELNT